jgi:hypothetical protein
MEEFCMPRAPSVFQLMNSHAGSNIFQLGSVACCIEHLSAKTVRMMRLNLGLEQPERQR